MVLSSEAIQAVLATMAEANPGQDAQRTLAAGIAIFYGEPNSTSEFVIKEYPDGRKERVTFDDDGSEICLGPYHGPEGTK